MQITKFAATVPSMSFITSFLFLYSFWIYIKSIESHEHMYMRGKNARDKDINYTFRKVAEII